MITYKFFIEDIYSNSSDKDFCALVGLVHMWTYNVEYEQGISAIKVKAKRECDVELYEILKQCNRFDIKVKYIKS